jgi:hypothetical protein
LLPVVFSVVGDPVVLVFLVEVFPTHWLPSRCV